MLFKHCSGLDKKPALLEVQYCRDFVGLLFIMFLAFISF
jgi:hypothetical protein